MHYEVKGGNLEFLLEGTFYMQYEQGVSTRIRIHWVTLPFSKMAEAKNLISW